MPQPDEIHAHLIAVYDKHAQAWDRHRPRIFFERPWLDRFAAHLPPGAQVLDAGCGSGEPIAGYFVRQGFRLTGIDASSEMLAIASVRLPQARWIQMDMRALRLTDKFDGIVSWDAFFHLTQDEQRRALIRFAEHLGPHGVLLVTIGDEAGEVVGTVEGEPVHHASLDPVEYREILQSAGFSEIDIKLQDETCDFHSILLAVR